MLYKDHCTQSCGLHLGAQVGNWTALSQQEGDCHEGQRGLVAQGRAKSEVEPTDTDRQGDREDESG